MLKGTPAHRVGGTSFCNRPYLHFCICLYTSLQIASFQAGSSVHHPGTYRPKHAGHKPNQARRCSVEWSVYDHGDASGCPVLAASGHSAFGGSLLSAGRPMSRARPSTYIPASKAQSGHRRAKAAADAGSRCHATGKQFFVI